jgi:hypothetical protein
MNRVDVVMERGDTTWVQLSRGAAAELDLVPGDMVGISRAGPSGRGRGTFRGPNSPLPAPAGTLCSRPTPGNRAVDTAPAHRQDRSPEPRPRGLPTDRRLRSISS